MKRHIELAVQPAYNCKTNKIEYAEILIRKYRGIDSPARILKFVSKNHVEDTFDMDVLEETLKLMKESKKKLKYPIGVNLCPVTAEKDDIADKIIELIDDYGVNHKRIVIEINEGTNFDNNSVHKNMRKLRSLGIRIALDDFGVAKTNLGALMHNSIDIVKVDRSFVEKPVPEEEESRNEILKAMLKMCNALKLKNIVEGIETNDELALIEQHGYCIVQGYLFEKPVNFKDFLETQ